MSQRPYQQHSKSTTPVLLPYLEKRTLDMTTVENFILMGPLSNLGERTGLWSMLQLMLYEAYFSIGCLLRHLGQLVINAIMYSPSGLLIPKSMLSLILGKNEIFYNVLHHFLTWQCCTSSARTWITDWGPPFTPNRSSSSSASRAAWEEKRRKDQLRH